MAEPDQPSQGQITPELYDVLADSPLQADDVASISNDSSVGGSCLTSLSSGTRNYRYENGRRYHAFREGSYFVPNDDEEQDRMDLVHLIYHLVLGGKLHLAPIGNKPKRVMDLGTGTGIWAMDFADEHPFTEVLGTDLSPIQPGRTPPNCVFEIDDFESDWYYQKPFDFIHARELEGCIGDDELFFQKAFENLTPGGYLEMQGVYTDFKSDDGTKELAENAVLWMEKMTQGAAEFGKPLDNAIRWKKEMEDAGFQDVKQEVFKIPIGDWPEDPRLKEIGKFQSIQELKVVESYTPAIFSRIYGWEQEKIQDFMDKVQNDLCNPEIHLYLPVYCIWGRKPE